MTAPSTATPRWEWRAFGESFADLEAVMPQQPPQLAHDIYILGDTSDANVKIREDTIDVKRLTRVSNGLERWSPVFTAPFPLGCDQVRRVFAEWPVPAPPCTMTRRSALEFLADVVAPLGGLHIIGVGKQRRHAVVDGCLIERTTLDIGGHVFESAAVEMADADRVRQLLRTFHLDRFDNLNYVTFLKRVLGIRPLPRTRAFGGPAA
jgi:hypothetical protein